MPSNSPLFAMLQARGIRRIELAAYAGVDPKTVTRLLRGDYVSMKIGTICQIAKTLGVAPADIVPLVRASPRRGRQSDEVIPELGRGIRPKPTIQ